MDARAAPGGRRDGPTIVRRTHETRAVTRPAPTGVFLPVKRHRGEPGHTRDTRDTRAHAGTRGHTDHTDETGKKDTGGSRDTHHVCPGTVPAPFH